MTSASRRKTNIFSSSDNASLNERLPVFEHIFQQIQDELKVIDRHGRIVYLNAAAAKGLGASPKKLINRFITEFYTNDLSPAEWNRRRFSLLKKKRVPMTFQRVRWPSSGKTKVMEITAVYFQHKSEEFILSIARDVTEQMAVHSRLRDSEDMHRMLSEEAGEPIVIIDLAGTITYANKAAVQALQLNPKKFFGKHYLGFIHPNSRKTAREYFAQAQISQEHLRGELEVILKKGRRIPVEVTIMPIRRNEETIAMHVIVRDISRRKEFEQLSLEAERMKAVQLFVAGTSQELKHPLMAVLKRTDALISNYKEKSFEYLSFREFSELLNTMAAIQKQVKYCYDTLERMVDINKRKAGFKDISCNVNAVLRSLIQEKENQFRMHNIICKAYLSEKPQEIKMGEIEFTQVATRLLDNAMEAMPAGGVLSIRTNFSKNKKFVHIDVKDNGVGIPKENMVRLFEPFFTTKHSGKGQTAGLGLAIVQLLVKAADGAIHIASSLRRGTTVSVRLPILRKHERQ